MGQYYSKQDFDQLMTKNDNDNQEICKYCHCSKNELLCGLNKPCLCTDPVCDECLCRHLDFTKREKCEICNCTYQLNTSLKIYQFMNEMFDFFSTIAHYSLLSIP